MTLPQPHDSLIANFISRLESLDAGGRARLKRNAGSSLGDARNVYQVFFALLPSHVQEPGVQEDFFLVATLFPVGTKRDQSQPQYPPRNLGDSLGIVRRRAMLEQHNSERGISLDRRFAALLDADREQLPFRLRQAVSLLAARDVAIDWRQLLCDVLRWSADGHRVQRMWASYYFGGTQMEPGNAALMNSSTDTTQDEEVQP